MQPYIFLVGKSDPQSETINSIRQLGYRVGIFYDDNTSLKHPEAYDTALALNFNDIHASITTLDINSLTIAGLVCTYENYVTAKAVLSEVLHVPSLSVTSAKMATDKYLMRDAFMKKDPTITPRFAKVNSEEELLAFASSSQYPLILKPTNLVKSLLVLRCDNEKELRENFSYAQSMIHELYKKYAIYDRQPQLIVEEFITGKSCSVAAFVDADGVPYFCNGIVGLTTAREHGVNDTYLYRRELPLTLDDHLSAKIFAVARKGVEALEMRSSPAHIELMYDGDTVKIIEIGARIGGYRPRMYKYSYGLALAEQEVLLSVGQTPQVRGTFTAYSAVYELFPTREGMFKKVVGDVDTSRYTYFKVNAKENGHIGPAKNGYKAAAIVIVSHTDKVIFDELCKSVDTLRIEVA